MRQTSPREYERLTLLRYQDRAVARHYHSEYTGPWTLTTLPARVVAMRERRIIDQAMSNGFDHAAPPVRKVLDLPCGAGKLAVVFARHPFSVIAADISHEMMALAEGEYRKAPGFTGFVRADAAATGFEDAQFDAVVCLRLLHRVPDAVRAAILVELSRICRRYVVLSAGLTGPLQELRRALRRRITGASTVPYPVTRAVLTSQLSHAGLTPLRWAPVLPVLSSEWIVLCEKRVREEA